MKELLGLVRICENYHENKRGIRTMCIILCNHFVLDSFLVDFWSEIGILWCFKDFVTNLCSGRLLNVSTVASSHSAVFLANIA